jgi:hypothetical protein
MGRNASLLKGARLMNNAIPGSIDTQMILTAGASSLIAWTALPFYVPQLLFWILGLVGIGIETIPFADLILPGDLLFFFCYFVIAIIGLCSMVYVVFIYTIRGVQCFEGVRTLTFMCCITGYLVPFLNLFPWVAFWMLSVLFARRDEE